jgi:uncharacterized membrane protein HdeD (DUF308 family)
MNIREINFESVGNSLKDLKRHKWFLILAGALMVLLGIYSMFHPVTAILSLAVYIGVGFLAAGVIHSVFYGVMRSHGVKTSWFLVQGILEVIVAFLLLSNLGVTALSIPLMVAFWAMFDGVTRCVAAFEMRSLGTEKWTFLLIMGIISILFALMLIARPFAGIIAVTFMLGLLFVVWGASAIFEGFHLY